MIKKHKQDKTVQIKLFCLLNINIRLMFWQLERLNYYLKIIKIIGTTITKNVTTLNDNWNVLNKSSFKILKNTLIENK